MYECLATDHPRKRSLENFCIMSLNKNAFVDIWGRPERVSFLLPHFLFKIVTSLILFKFIFKSEHQTRRPCASRMEATWFVSQRWFNHFLYFPRYISIILSWSTYSKMCGASINIPTVPAVVTMKNI